MSIINNKVLANERYRIIVSTDIGGSDPDDFQSMVHYFLYSDLFDTEGLISSPWGEGTVKDIFDVIDQYEVDFPKLRSFSRKYPTPEYLRSITKQGVIEIAPYKGYGKATEGSDWIIQCAKKDDSRPLYILAWGLLEDLAQALHDDPSIKDKLRVYYIGGPNKKWGLNAYEYIRENFPDLWIIENNSTYRGWFVGGNQEQDFGNQTFVSNHAHGHGALGNYFAEHLGGVIKMGDTPSVAYLLKGTPEYPENPSWGGSFVRVKNRPKSVYKRNTTLNDIVEVFEVLELVFNGPDIGEAMDKSVFSLIVQGQEFEGFYCGNGEYKVRFMPKSMGKWTYLTKSEIPELNGQTGEFTCVEESKIRREKEDCKCYTNWWSDILDDKYSEKEHKGAKTVSMWREEFLRDFQERFDRCLDVSNSHLMKDILDKEEVTKIIAFGDSITQGNLEVTGEWPHELQEKLDNWKKGKYNVINKGKNGNTTSNAFDRIESDILPNLPGILIVAFGINDCNHRAWAKVPRVSVAEYEKNIREFHRIATSKGGCCIFVVNHILQPLDGSRFLKQGNGKTYQENLEVYNSTVRNLSRELNVPIIDFPKYIIEKAIDIQSLLIEDGVHLSRYGYTIYTEYIFQRLKELGI